MPVYSDIRIKGFHAIAAEVRRLALERGELRRGELRGVIAMHNRNVIRRHMLIEDVAMRLEEVGGFRVTYTNAGDVDSIKVVS